MDDQTLKCLKCGKTYRSRNYDEQRTYTCRACDGKLNPVSRVGTPPPEQDQPEQDDPLVGGRIGPYQIIEKLGEGGMGAVYKAEHTGLRKVRALKVLPEHVAKRSLKAVGRFMREAQAAAALEHPNVVTVHHVGEADGRHFIDMDFVEGESVQDRLAREGRFSLEEATRIVLDAAKALATAHEQNIVHRDIKPANILLDTEGKVRVADFGLAKDIEEDTLITEEGQGGLGTVQFMSPEQTENAQVDGRSDIYSLGCTYYYLLTGKLPFPGNSRIAVAMAHKTAPVPDPSAAVPSLPKSVCRITEKAMAKNREDRYQTCEEMVDALSRVMAEIESPAPKASPLGERLCQLTGNRVALGAAIGVVAVALGVGMWAFGNRGKDGHAPLEKVLEVPAEGMEGEVTLARILQQITVHMKSGRKMEGGLVSRAGTRITITQGRGEVTLTDGQYDRFELGETRAVGESEIKLSAKSGGAKPDRAAVPEARRVPQDTGTQQDERNEQKSERARRTLPGPVKYPVVKDAGVDRFEAYPRVIRLSNGSLLMAFYARPPRQSLGKVACVRSEDNGRTWSDLTTIADTEGDDRNGVLIETDDGTVLCHFHIFRPSTKSAQLQMAVSGDYGKTWRLAADWLSGAPATSGIGAAAIELADGALILPIYTTASGSGTLYRPALLRSQDRGKTWGDLSLIDADTKHRHCEPALVVLPDRRWLCLMRPCMCRCYSSDQGRTWTKPERVGFRGDCPCLLRTSAGVLLCAHRHPGTSLSYSLDDGAHWTGPLTIDPCKGGYPSMVELPDGSILCVYCDGSKTSDIWSVRFEAAARGITWLER